MSLSLCVLVLVLALLPLPASAVLSDLPRFDLQAFAVSSGDLGSYSFFTCEGGRDSPDGKSRSCEFDTDEAIVYAGGAGFYTAIGVLAYVLVVLGAIFFLIFSIFKLCCSCCCNSVLPFDVKRVRSGVKKWAVGMFSVCLVMILTCFFVSTFSGNHAITENTSSEYSAANSMHGLSNIVKSYEPSITRAALSSTSQVMAPATFKLNRTLNAAISIPDLIEAFEIVDETIPRLPNPRSVIDILNATKFIVFNSSDHVGYILLNLEDVDTLVEAIFNGTRSMYNLTIDLAAVNEDVLDSITILNTSVADTIDFLDEIVASGGIVPLCLADVNAVQRVINDGLLPDVGTFSDASTGVTASTSRILSGAMDGLPVEVNEMNRKLIAIDTNISALPNFTITGDRLVYLNDTIKNAFAPSGLLTNLTTQLEELGDKVQLPVPILYDFADVLVGFEVNLANLTTEVSDTVRIINVLLPLIETLLPQFELLVDEVNKMFNADALLPILDIVIDQFVSVNATLMELPSAADDALDSIRDVNETIYEFLYNGTLSEIIDTMTDANETVTDALSDASDQLENLSDFEEVLVDSVSDYNISEYNETIYDAIILIQGVRTDLNDTVQTVYGFTASLKSVVIEEDFVNSLYSLQSSLEGLINMLDRAVGSTGDYIYLAQGYCIGNEDVYCSTDDDCTSVGTTCNTASKGDFRCSSPIGATSCTDDSDCTAVDASSYCLADTTRTTSLHTVLVAFSDNSTDLDVSDLLADLNDIMRQSDVNLTDATGVLNEGADALDLFDTSEMLDLIVAIEDGISELDTSTIMEQLESVQETIDDVDFDGFIESIDDQLDIYDRVANKTFIDDWIETFETFKDFMFKDMYLKTYLTNVNDNNLNEELSAHGPSGAFRHIAFQIDRSYEDVRRNQTSIGMSELDEPFSTRYTDSYEVLDRMGASRYPTKYSNNDKHGALYYLFALNNHTINGVRSVPVGHPLARGIVANAEGYKYRDEFNDGDDKDSVYCFTEACFEYTINIMHTSPMSEVNAELYPPSYEDDANDDGGGADLPLDVSRQDLMTLLWVPVLLLLFIGVCSLACAFVPRCHKMHNRCNCCFLTCALTLLPFIFLLSSIFLLFALIGEDVCTSGTAIGETYISQYGDEYCADTLSGTGTLSNCKFNWTLPDAVGEDENITISVNVLDTYNALFQKECGMAVDPFEKIALDLAEQIRPLPIQATQKELSESTYVLRPALEDLLNSTAVNYGQVMYDLIAETHADGHKVLSCESMSLIYADVEETFCEGVVLPGAWLIGSWYLVAWVICCCGLPSSCATLVSTKLIKEELLVGGEDQEQANNQNDEENSVGETNDVLPGGDGRNSNDFNTGVVNHGYSNASANSPRSNPGVEMVGASSHDGGGDMVLLGASDNGDETIGQSKGDESIRSGGSTAGFNDEKHGYRKEGVPPTDDTLL